MSSLFNLRVPQKEKIESLHPWAATIKDRYLNKIKTAHNTVHNPKIPKKQEKVPNKDRITFTVIGNRVTKEFIYCSHLVRGLYKYRWKNFGPPIVRGVTGVEWPTIWNSLNVNYGGLTYCLNKQVAVLVNDKFLGGEEELKEFVESKYAYYLGLDYYKESIKEFRNFVSSSGRPCVYMHVSIDGKQKGTLIFMLYADVVPNTCENFLRRCKTRKGGYSGTPVHRIVKDSWIQCGGYGLKETDLNCENFIIPHDRRGVLCMANEDRHKNCSTQFFVLLQPAPWMAFKYVAFGQLIDGDATLKEIQSVPTWYESPRNKIIIDRAGILNLECQDIVINKETNAYIQGHIENLVVIGKLFTELLMDKVWLEIEFRRVTRLHQTTESAEEELPKGLHETKRFIRNKEDIQKQIEKSENEDIDGENNEFDVEIYKYEPEEDVYSHKSPPQPDIEPIEERPYYIPLTDVLYPGETDSTFDVKKLLRGDYCLESDLDKNPPRRPINRRLDSFAFEIFQPTEHESDEDISDESLDSDEEKEIRRYLKLHVDRVSFAGGVIKNIAKGSAKSYLFGGGRKSELITDEELRRLRLESLVRRRSSTPRKVMIATPDNEKEFGVRVKRKQTGFVRAEDVEKARMSLPHIAQKDEPEEPMSRKVRIHPSVIEPETVRMSTRPRRQTGFVRGTAPGENEDSDTQIHRQSVLIRLYEDVIHDEHGSTLKDYKSVVDTQGLRLLTYSPPTFHQSKSDENTKDRMRQSVMVDDSYDKLLNIQHNKHGARKVSSDYVTTIDQAEHNKTETSLRTIEFAKSRPSISVIEYQKRNQKISDDKDNEKRGLRLPGDTPLYSETTIHHESKIF